MGKKGKKQQIQKRSPKTPTEPPAPPRKGFSRLLGALSPTGWFWALISLVLTFVGSYYLLRPQIEVEPDDPLDIGQPLKTPFRITNRGMLPIYGVLKWCGIKNLETDSAAPPTLRLSDLGVQDGTEPAIPKLDSGESTSVLISEDAFPVVLQGKPFKSGDILVIVDYKTAIVGIQKRQIFRFETRRTSNNEIKWYHKASSE